MSLRNKLDSRRVEYLGDRVAELLDALGVDVVDRRESGLDELLAGGPLDGAEHVPFPRRDEQQRGTRTACPAGATDAVHVGLGVVRDVVVEHVRDALDVESARARRRWPPGCRCAVLELGDGPLALGLRDVTVDRGRGKPRARSFSATSSWPAWCGRTRSSPRRTRPPAPGQRVHLAWACDLDVALRDVVGGRGLGLDLHLTGSCRYFVVILRMADGMVAENSATCLYSGVSARIRSTSSAKPICSISSASSSTR